MIIPALRPFFSFPYLCTIVTSPEFQYGLIGLFQLPPRHAILKVRQSMLNIRDIQTRSLFFAGSMLYAFRARTERYLLAAG
jgi:hypothetical protein